MSLRMSAGGQHGNIARLLKQSELGRVVQALVVRIMAAIFSSASDICRMNLEIPVGVRLSGADWSAVIES